MKFSSFILSITAVAGILLFNTPTDAFADFCEGCENFQGAQLCDPFQPDFRWEECEVEQEFCQLSGDRCDAVVTYNDFQADTRIGPAGTYVPRSTLVATRGPPIISPCNGLVVGSHQTVAIVHVGFDESSADTLKNAAIFECFFVQFRSSRRRDHQHLQRPGCRLEPDNPRGAAHDFSGVNGVRSNTGFNCRLSRSGLGTSTPFGSVLSISPRRLSDRR